MTPHRRLRVTGCLHRGLRAVTPEEEPRLDERRRQPYTCDDCSNTVTGPSRFTQAFVMNLILAERAARLRAEEAPA